MTEPVSILQDPKEPASIRCKNPGAMWGGNPISKHWGEMGNIALNDGLHQNNHIAVFPDKVHGAAAQFDLWRQHYTPMTLESAIRKWSGGNSSAAYMQSLCLHTGLSPSSLVTEAILASPTGLALMMAQAQWEAGKPYPMSDAEWKTAQDMVFHATVPVDLPDTHKPEPVPQPAPAAPPTSLWTLILSIIKAIFKR